MSSTTTAEAPLPTEGRETRSPLLTLPVEIRLQIYSYLLPTQRIYINICDAPTDSPDTEAGDDSSSQTGNSAVSFYLTSIHLFNSVLKSHGLPLLQVCTRTNAEIIPLLRTKIFRFHCTKCFKRFLDQFATPTSIYTYQSQVRDKSSSGCQSAAAKRWLRHVEIELDLDERPTTSMGRTADNEGRPWPSWSGRRIGGTNDWHGAGHVGRYSHTIALAVMDSLKSLVWRGFGMWNSSPQYDDIVQPSSMDWDQWGYTILKKRWPVEFAEIESRGTNDDGTGPAVVDGQDLVARVPAGYLSSKLWLVKIEFNL